MISIPMCGIFFKKVKRDRRLTEKEKWKEFMDMQARHNRILALRVKLGIY